MEKEDNNNFPFEVCDVDPEVNKAMKDQYEDVQDDGYVRIGPKGYFLPKFFLEDGPALYNMEPRPDQVFVAGYPRSGTTWAQQMVWLITHDLDYAESEKTTMSEKCKFLEVRSVVHKNAIINYIEKNQLGKPSIEFLMANATPLPELTQNHSFFKTHLPLSLLPPRLLETSKVVYVARDPRDAIVSLFHFCKGGFWPFKKDFKTMWKSFIKDTVIYNPYFEHVKEFWEERNNPNLLFLFYEDIQNDRLNTLRRVAKFFDKSYSDEQLETACRYLDFSNLQHKPSFNLSCLKKHGFMKSDAEPFVRKGVIGDWRNYFDEEMILEAEQWIANSLRDTDLRFPTVHITLDK